MNLLLFDEQDFDTDSTRIRITGRRLRHLLQVHHAKVGEQLKVGQINGQLGHARVIEIDETAALLEPTLTSDPPPPVPTRLVLALPRPKVLHRILRICATLGFKHMDVVNAWRVDKSYWKSRRLEPEAIRESLWQGLEMSRDTRLPNVEFHRFFRDYFQQSVPTLDARGERWLCHPIAEMTLLPVMKPPTALAIGPEGGFIEREVRSFVDSGFLVASFGDRILPVDTALTYAVARFA